MKQEDVGQVIKEMSEIEFPEGLHGKILRQIVFLRFRTPFITVVLLLTLNLVISGWRIWEQLLEGQTLAMVGMLWETVEMSFTSLFQFVLDVFEIAPVGHILLLIINFAVLGYIGIYVPRLLSKTKRPTLA